MRWNLKLVFVKAVFFVVFFFCLFKNISASGNSVYLYGHSVIYQVLAKPFQRRRCKHTVHLHALASCSTSSCSAMGVKFCYFGWIFLFLIISLSKVLALESWYFSFLLFKVQVIWRTGRSTASFILLRRKKKQSEREKLCLDSALRHVAKVQLCSACWRKDFQNKGRCVCRGFSHH